jgi:hypothetical protein
MKKLLLLLVVAGCNVTAPIDHRGPPPAKPTIETVFSVLADNAAADPEFYATTDDLKRVVNRLVATKRITQAQADSVVSVLGKDRRKVTDADLNAIRGL